MPAVLSEPDFIHVATDTDPSVDVEIDREIVARKGLYAFLQLAWPVVEPTTPFVGGYHIEAMCEAYEAISRGQLRQLLIMIPPGSTKSLSTCVIWPGWEWTWQPSTRWNFASYSLGLAERDSRKCGDLIRSEWYQARWGDRFRLTTDAVTYLLNDKTGERKISSVGSEVTGRHSDRLVIDDPHNVKEVESEKIREGTIFWHDKAWWNRVNDFHKSSRVVIAQRTHEKDLIGHLEKQGGYEMLRFPEEYDVAISRSWSLGQVKDPRTEDGELLRPNRFGAEEVATAKKVLGPVDYAAQHQQRPTPRGGNLINEDQLKKVYYEAPDAFRLGSDGFGCQIFEKIYCPTFVIVDPAKSKKKSADFMAIGVFTAVPSANNDILVRLMIRERVGYANIVPRLSEVCEIYRPLWVGIEADGFQVMVVKECREVLPGGAKKWPFIPTVQELETESKGKVTRAQPLMIRLREGSIWLPPEDDQHPWVYNLKSELTTVTGVDDSHDDQFDVCAWAVLAYDRFGGGSYRSNDDAFAAGRAPRR